jgi:hypothetical protein
VDNRGEEFFEGIGRWVGRGFALFTRDFWNWILCFLILCRGMY